MPSEEGIDAASIVHRWSAHWPLGASPAVSSVLDILAGDVLESEGSNRPAGPLVVGDRLDGRAFEEWTLRFPVGPPRGLGGFFYRGRQKLLARIRRMSEEGPARRSAFQTTLATVEPIAWAGLADMELVSLAMGHLGPARQGAVLPVVEGVLVANAAAVACSLLIEQGGFRNLAALASLASVCAAGYEPEFRALAQLSSNAFEELARRATARGVRTNGPFSLPVTAWVSVLTSPAPRA
jgi:hypothetical protein